MQIEKLEEATQSLKGIFNDIYGYFQWEDKEYKVGNGGIETFAHCTFGTAGKTSKLMYSLEMKSKNISKVEENYHLTVVKEFR